MEMSWGSKVFIILFKVEISSFKIFGKEWMLKISIFWASLWTKITAFLNCSSSPKVEWFWGHQLMQISWIGSNSCQLPSDRANLSSVSWYLRCSDSDKIDTIKRIKHNNINLKSHVDVQDCLYQIHDSNGSFELQSLNGRGRCFPFSQIKRSTTLILSTATASVLLGS